MRRREAMLLLAGGAAGTAAPFTPSEDQLLEDLSTRAFQYFWDAADRNTGLVLDRFRADGTPVRRDPIASIAATGFGLSAICIASERRWVSRADAQDRVTRILTAFLRTVPNVHGWFYHFLDAGTGQRAWRSELSSIDTALLVAGALTARGYFGARSAIGRLATAIYNRVDFRWMLNGDPHILSHGWKPESGFLRARWGAFSECLLLYALAIGSRTHPIPATSWASVRKPVVTYAGLQYVEGGPLFVHQYPHAWFDLRKSIWWQNSKLATLANRAFCISMAQQFPKSYSQNLWGISASDSDHGYVAWGTPGVVKGVDGTVVPCAAAGSLMFEPALCLQAVRTMNAQYGQRAWKRYGFVDAFNPTTGWIDADVIGIDVGITLLSAENARTGNVWRWFMANAEAVNGLRRGGFAKS